MPDQTTSQGRGRGRMACRDGHCRDLGRVLLLPIIALQAFLLLVVGGVFSLLCCVCCVFTYRDREKRRRSLSSDAYSQEEQGEAYTSTELLDITGISYQSFYHQTKDGTKIAVDVWLPECVEKEGKKVGCILHQARYFRSFQMWYPLGKHLRDAKPINVINNPYFEAFLGGGLAIVSMDIRGSGASYGTNRGPWMEEETGDSHEIMEWILRQPWCNGKIGTWGISYEGTAALLTAVSGHFAVAATCPMYFFCSIYQDIGFHGGIFLQGFVSNWEKITRALDDNAVSRLVPPSWFVINGVSPVPGRARELKLAVREHWDNWSATKDGRHVQYVDDRSQYNGMCAADLSPSVRIDRFIAQLKEGLVPRPPDFFLVAGWYDTTASCVLRLAHHLQGLCDVRLLLGPWQHGGIQHARLFPGGRSSLRSKFGCPREVSRFFQARLGNDAGVNGELTIRQRPPIVRYYVAQEEVWKTPPAFPMPCQSGGASLISFLLDPNAVNIHASGARSTSKGSWASRFRRKRNSLDTILTASLRMVTGDDVVSNPGKMTLAVDIHRSRSFRGVSRYQAMTEPFRSMHYDQDHSSIHHLRFTSPPFLVDTEITGYPLVSLWVSSSTNDASLFVYLQIVDNTGVSHYVTEGNLRVSSRRLVDDEDGGISVMNYPTVPLPTYKREDAVFLEPDGPPVRASFPLQPISYLVKAGQRLRLAVGGSDPTHYLPLDLPHGATRYSLHLHTGPHYPSSLTIPCVGKTAEDRLFAAADIPYSHPPDHPSASSNSGSNSNDNQRI